MFHINLFSNSVIDSLKLKLSTLLLKISAPASRFIYRFQMKADNLNYPFVKFYKKKSIYKIYTEP